MKEEIKGLIGTILTISAPWLDFLGTLTQVIAGIAGLYLIYISIKEKKLKIKYYQDLHQQLKNKEEDED